ncbi:hypothetical protein F2Q68_00041643 [Brassica cretica]|uniref:Uncharacterized protein n=1 Tax=Brassica cretica TaxID=69181 RepID=A0A8S9MQU5_BRACR|nr:hypothetical protein F2Q68_00041643 [Brassica cretica]
MTGCVTSSRMIYGDVIKDVIFLVKVVFTWRSFNDSSMSRLLIALVTTQLPFIVCHSPRDYLSAWIHASLSNCRYFELHLSEAM